MCSSLNPRSCLQDGSHVQRHTVTPSSSLLHFVWPRVAHSSPYWTTGSAWMAPLTLLRCHGCKVQTASFGKSTTMRSSNSWTALPQSKMKASLQVYRRQDGLEYHEVYAGDRVITEGSVGSHLPLNILRPDTSSRVLQIFYRKALLPCAWRRVGNSASWSDCWSLRGQTALHTTLVNPEPPGQQHAGRTNLRRAFATAQAAASV